MFRRIHLIDLFEHQLPSTWDEDDDDDDESDDEVDMDQYVTADAGSVDNPESPWVISTQGSLIFTIMALRA